MNSEGRFVTIRLAIAVMTTGLLAFVALILQTIGGALSHGAGVSGVLAPVALAGMTAGSALMFVSAEKFLAIGRIDRLVARHVAVTSTLVAIVALAPDVHRPGELGRLQWALIVSGVICLLASPALGEGASRLVRRWIPGLVSFRGRVFSQVITFVEATRGLVTRFVVGASNLQRTHPRSQRAWDGLLIASVAVVCAVVQIRFLRVPDIGDQADYFNAASDFPATVLTHRHARIGLLFPVRALQEFFGFSEVAYYVVPVLSAALFSVATYMLGRLLFNRAVGLGAGIIVLLNPYMMRDSSHLLPDIPAAAMFTWAIVLVICASRRLGTNGDTSWTIRVLLIGAGALLGWAYLTREFTVVFFPLVLLALWALRMRMRLITYVAGAALAMLLFEMVVAHSTWESPLARFETVLNRRSTPSTEAQRRGPLDTLLLLPRLLLNDSVGPFFIALILLVVVGGLVLRDRRSILIVSWSFGMWAFFLLISHQSAFDVVHLVSGGDLSFASLRFQKLRYWSPIWPAVTVGGLGGMYAVFRWSAGLDERRDDAPTDHPSRSSFVAGAGLAILLTALITLGVGLNQVQGWTFWWISDESTHYSQFRTWLDEHGQDYDVIWTDNYTARVLPVYTLQPHGRPVWEGDIRRFNRGPDWLPEAPDWLPESDLASGLIVFHEDSLSRTEQNARPQYAQNPPEPWNLVAEFGTLTVLEIRP